MRFDAGQPDGAPRKLVENSVIRALGWRPTVDLASGLEGALENFLLRERRVRAPALFARGWCATA